jgi:uncharacterized protein (TIRG00374 family)
LVTELKPEPPETEPPKKPGGLVGNLIKGVLGLAASGFFVWLSLRGKDLHAIWEHLQQANYLYLVPYLVILTLIHLCRTVRWGILLEPLDHQISFKRLNAVAAVGFMGLIVLPFRLGELTRPILIADWKKIRFTSATASIVVERVVDGLAMALLLLATLPFVHTTSPEIDYVRGAGLIAFGVFGGAAVFLGVAYWKRELALKLARAIGNPISPTLTHKVVALMDSFIQGLRVVPSVSKILWFFTLTFAYWGLNGLGLGILGRGFGFELNALGAYTVLAVLTIGVMIPSGPGMVGTFQYFTELGLKLFLPAAVVAGAGAAYSNVVWGAQFVQQIVFGLFFMFFGGVSLTEHYKEWKKHQAEDPKPGDDE